MRITAETKARTREEILEAARVHFAKNGFESATTRDIASAAGIAVGTLFNYFPTKEALALNLIGEVLRTAREEFHRSVHGRESLDELLFSHAAIALRHLRPLRSLVLPVFESTLSPVADRSPGGEAEGVRTGHLAVVRRLISSTEGEPDVTFVSLHLYWTLFLGVIAFWAHDDSPNQEMTLALLDQSMRMFASTVHQDRVSTSTGVTP